MNNQVSQSSTGVGDQHNSSHDQQSKSNASGLGGLGGGASRTKKQPEIKQLPVRNLEGSLEQCKDQLRDAYMNFKELHQRCVVDISEVRKEESKVYYFKPDTFLLDDPEKQKAFRERTLRKIMEMPKPDPPSFLGDELHRQMCKTLADQSTPRLTKRNLSYYFKRRQYKLQHQKYKLLCRWAHHALTTDSLERIGSEATFIYGKLEYNLESTIRRLERLEQEDSYDTATPEVRPKTKSETGTGSLYLEKIDMLPQSLIKDDDVEIYLRGMSYRNKVSKVINKLLARLKWLPLAARQEIYEKALEANHELKLTNMDNQSNLVSQIEERVHGKYIMNSDLEQELKTIKSSYYISQYNQMFVTEQDRVLASWKADHDTVPNLISNNQELKIRILDRANNFGLSGDIELDQGFSFAYQISVYFPTHFQKQVIKSQFSIYDAFAKEEDPNEAQKRTLMSMTKVDTNIFRDISTTKSTVPSDEALNMEMRNSTIKIMRLKNSTSWLKYICLTPNEPDWHKKQQAILLHENPVDSLLQHSMNFLDVADLASINKVIEETAQLHQNNVKLMATQHNPHNQIHDKSIPTQDGEKIIKVSEIESKNMTNDYFVMQQHLLAAVKDYKPSMNDNIKTDHEQPKIQSKNSLLTMPVHLISAFYTLRFMESKDAKTKILYSLNYFRAIQRRLSLDLKEFGTRERISGTQIQPYLHPTEANQNIVNSSNMAANQFETPQQKIRSFNNQKENETQGGANPFSTTGGQGGNAVFDKNALKNIKNMASLKHYKTNGYFNNRLLSTCPTIPKVHFTYGEPNQHEPIYMEEDDNKASSAGVSERALKLMGRIDAIEINEAEQEVYIKDDFGIYIIYDCVLNDMTLLEKEIIRIGSYYISKQEVLSDPDQEKVFPYKDRMAVLDDILQREAKFHFLKVKLIQCYMECYEHVSDPLEQQRLMQVITDLMARRPRLNMQANYFLDSYDAEFRCLEKQFELVSKLIETQMKIETEENKRLQSQLQLSYQLANTYEHAKWNYKDAESIIKSIMKAAKAKQQAEEYVKKQETQGRLKEERSQTGARINDDVDEESDESDYSENSNISPEKETPPQDQSPKKEKNKSFKLSSQLNTNKENERSISEEEEDEDSDQSINEHTKFMKNYFANKDNQFSELLGLPQISIETLYNQYKEKDKSIIKLMGEHSNFIQIHEGYPEFMIHREGSTDPLVGYKVNPWSIKVGSLDFFESLDFITKLHSILGNCCQELNDSLKPYNSTVETFIEIQVLEKALEEFQTVCSFFEGTLVEYKGREFVEDESITGNSEKMIFFSKEMIAQLSHSSKSFLNPFIIGKLDMHTINFFTFPQVPKKLSFYSESNKMKLEIETMMEISKKKLGRMKNRMVTDTGGVLNQIGNQMMNSRNVEVPTQLLLYCNLLEMMRLRQELILTVTETCILEKIYEQQTKQCKALNMKSYLPESISFEELEVDGDQLNYIDEGPASSLDIELAINEFDPSLRSNLNFRSPDAFKMSILTSGLEELRACLTYQLMQKQLLLIGTRMNQLVIDMHSKALSEIRLLQNHSICLPNSIINVKNCFSKSMESLDQTAVQKERFKFSQNLSNSANLLLFNVCARKKGSRTTIAKEYSNYKTTCCQKLIKNQCIQRILRAFKIKQMIKYCNRIFLEVQLDAQKIQSVAICQRLREIDRYFTFDPKRFSSTNTEKVQLFNYETADLFENINNNYHKGILDPKVRNEDGIVEESDPTKVINVEDMEIIDYHGIPSSASLINAPAANIQDLRNCIQKQHSINHQINPVTKEMDKLYLSDPSQTNDVEKTIKPFLYTFNQVYDVLENRATMTQFVLNNQQTAEGGASQDINSTQNEKQQNALLTKDMQPTKFDYLEALDFGESQYAKLISYYFIIERVLSLEWCILKLQFKQNEMVHLDHCMQAGLPFWHDESYQVDASVIRGGNNMQQNLNQQQDQNESENDGVMSPSRKANIKRSDVNVNLNNRLMGQFVTSKVIMLKQKSNIAAELVQINQIFKNLISKYKEQRLNVREKFLSSYEDFKFMQLTGSLVKMVEQFLMRNNQEAVISCQNAIRKLTRMDHIKILYQTNNFHVNNSIVQNSQINLENCNLAQDLYSPEERVNFNRCVQPIINEKALEPPQVTLFMSLYQSDPIRKGHNSIQFAGQLSRSHNGLSIPCLDTILLEMSLKDRQYTQSNIVQTKYVLNDFMEALHNDTSMANMTTEDIYNFQQLQDAMKVMTEITQAQKLKTAIICWNENSLLSTVPEIFKEQDQRYKNEYFLKILEQKEQIRIPWYKKQSKQIQQQDAQADDGTNPQDKDLVKMKNKIDKLENNQSYATQQQEDERDKLVKVLRAEFQQQKRRVTLDSYFTNKAMIKVLTNEIEKKIIIASVQTLDSETTALTRCFTLAVPQIGMHIHPFQQFAATFFDQVDTENHLDLINKVQAVQTFLTKLRNRGTIVETLTSGPGMVFTIKDINECLQVFCRSIIKYSEKELDSRTEQHIQEKAHLMNLLYYKDQKIGNLEHRIMNVNKNLDHIIDAGIFEKGNQLIYQLDCQSRLLRLFKENFNELEQVIRKEVLSEQGDKFRRKQVTLDQNIEKFKDFQKNLELMVKSTFANEKDLIKIKLKRTADMFKNTDPESNYKEPTLLKQQKKNVVINSRDSIQNSPTKSKKSLRKGQSQNVSVVNKINEESTVIAQDGSIVPPGFQHYTNCSCYQQNPDYPIPTVELAEIEVLSEQEARLELARMCTLMRQQRLFWRTKEMLKQEKYQREIQVMKKQLTSNAFLWEQMAEAEKRETVLKQELLFTQQSLAAAEKVIQKLQEEMKKVEGERERLAKYKHMKAKKLKSLEDKIKKFEVFDNIDTEKLIHVLHRKEGELQQYKDISDNFVERYNALEVRKDRDIKQVEQKYQTELVKKQQVVEKMEAIKFELKMLESNDNTVAAVWKKKCLDLYDMSNQLRQENEEIRHRCKELIISGIQLADAVKTQDVQEDKTGEMLKNIKDQKNNIEMYLPKLKIGGGGNFTAPAFNTGNTSNVLNDSMSHPSVVTATPNNILQFKSRQNIAGLQKSMQQPLNLLAQEQLSMQHPARDLVSERADKLARFGNSTTGSANRISMIETASNQTDQLLQNIGQQYWAGNKTNRIKNAAIQNSNLNNSLIQSSQMTQRHGSVVNQKGSSSRTKQPAYYGITPIKSQKNSVQPQTTKSYRQHAPNDLKSILEGQAPTPHGKRNMLTRRSQNQKPIMNERSKATEDPSTEHATAITGISKHYQITRNQANIYSQGHQPSNNNNNNNNLLHNDSLYESSKGSVNLNQPMRMYTATNEQMSSTSKVTSTAKRNAGNNNDATKVPNAVADEVTTNNSSQKKMQQFRLTTNKDVGTHEADSYSYQ